MAERRNTYALSIPEGLRDLIFGISVDDNGTVYIAYRRQVVLHSMVAQARECLPAALVVDGVLLSIREPFEEEVSDG